MQRSHRQCALIFIPLLPALPAGITFITSTKVMFASICFGWFFCIPVLVITQKDVDEFSRNFRRGKVWDTKKNNYFQVDLIGFSGFFTLFNEM